MFGGQGKSTATGTGYLNDLWKWDGQDWIWISGSNLSNQRGTYGDRGVPLTTNIPGGRRSHGSYIDAQDNLWIFGGYGYGTGSTVCK